MSLPFRDKIQTLNPAFRIILSFLFVISAGTLLLKTPFAVEKSHSLSWLDAFFMSTSATCVTGLSLMDVSSTFSIFGELVLLLLMQIGGIGVMAMSSYLFLSFGRDASMKQRMLIQESFAGDYDVNWRTLVRTVIHFVFYIEFGGAILLSLLFFRDMPLLNSLYYGMFHSVSAFCNGGLSLFPDSFAAYRHDALMNSVLILLIISGGIGFFVMWEIKEWLKRRKRERYRFSLHTKTVLLLTVALLVFSTVVIWLLESQNSLFGESFLSRLIPSFFQATCARTAGLSTIDLACMGNDSIMIMMFLMFIGAAPGSCAGGVKITTVAVVAALFWSRIRGRNTTNILRRTLSSDLIGRSLSVIIASVAFILVSNVVLMITDIGETHFQRERMVSFLFETFSAFGTVGLSLGVTPFLNSFGKFIIIALMFFGRVGVMTMFVQAVNSRKGNSVEYAEEGLMIG